MFIASLIAMATRQSVHLNIMFPAKKIAAAQKYFSFLQDYISNSQ